MSEYGVTETGFRRKSFSDIKEDLMERAEDLFGEEVDLTPTSPVMMLINVSALELARLWDTAEYIYSSGYLEEASDQSLERLGMLTGVRRRSASRSTGEAIFSGESGRLVPIGTTISTLDGIKFVTTEDKVISDGSATIEIRALRTGSNGNVPPGSISVFVDSVVGVTSVTNSSATVGGEDVEIDPEFKMNIREALMLDARATHTAIRNALLNVDGVTSVSIVEEDDRSLTITIGGIGARGDLPPSKIDEIDEVIEDIRAFGIPVVWDTPDQVDILVDAEVVLENEPSNWESLVEGNIREYIDGLDVGRDVIYNKIIDVIFNTGVWLYDVDDLEISDDDGITWVRNNITITSNQKAMSDSVTITAV